MNKSLKITGVRTIFNIERPIVVFEVQGHEAIVRNPKQALTDLQNSARALDINPREFAGGIESVSQATKAKFVQALHDCIGATLVGDIAVNKAGDNYPVREGHPALTDQKHPMFGKVALGESLVAEKDNVWVEGFLAIAETAEEKMRRSISGQVASQMMSIFGFGAPAPAESLPYQAEEANLELPEVTAKAEATAEGFGTAKEKSGKQ